MEWQSLAACKGMTATFFPKPPPGSHPWQPEAEGIAAAKAICSGCEVRQECLDGALQRREAHGVWGGMGLTERKRLWRR